jgi:hypothetical protein
VPFDDLPAYGKSDAGAGVIAAGVQALEDKENAFKILRINANAVVADREAPCIVKLFDPHVDLWGSLPVELDGIADQVLEELSQLAPIYLECGQGIVCNDDFILGNCRL